MKPFLFTVWYNLSVHFIELIGLVAQWTRARGYEPRCQGFESLLARIIQSAHRKHETKHLTLVC